MRIFWPSIAFAGAVLLAGCAGVPVETLRTYSDAFLQARDAGDLLYDEISPIVSGKTVSKQTCGTSALGYPQCFNPRTALGTSNTRRNEDPSIKARRDALATVALYNSMLVDLAEGKSAEAFTARIDTLASLAGAVAALGVIPSGGLSALIVPGAAYASQMASRFETARANGLVRQSILDSKGDIQELLAALADDTPQIYRVFLAAREKDLVAINFDRNAARLAKNEAAQARAQKRYQATLDSITQFHEALTAYVQLLDRTSQALDSLVAAAAQEPGTAASLTLLAREAADIRAKSEAFWETIRDVRMSASTAGG